MPNHHATTRPLSPTHAASHWALWDAPITPPVAFFGGAIRVPKPPTDLYCIA